MYAQPDKLLVGRRFTPSWFLEFLAPNWGLWVGYQMYSASVSPVSTSETFPSDEDGFAWESCGSSIVLMRDCAACLADSGDPSRAFSI